MSDKVTAFITESDRQIAAGVCGGENCLNPECFCDEYQERILELIIHRPDLDYMQIALLTGSNITAVSKIAKDNNSQRKRGRKPLAIPSATTVD